jgi:hypothetical protein
MRAGAPATVPYEVAFIAMAAVVLLAGLLQLRPSVCLPARRQAGKILTRTGDRYG